MSDWFTSTISSLFGNQTKKPSDAQPVVETPQQAPVVESVKEGGSTSKRSKKSKKKGGKGKKRSYKKKVYRQGG